jgi:hypothetical protein
VCDAITRVALAQVHLVGVAVVPPTGQQ